MVATLALCAVAELDLAHAVGKGHRKRKFKKLPLSQSATHYPYLEFEKTAGFLSVMEQEFKEFNGKAEKARATATNCIIHL